MKKFVATLSAATLAMTLAACGSTAAPEATATAAPEATATAEAAAEMGTGVYTVYNATGEAVTELTVVNNDGSEEAENYAADGLKAGKSVVITKEAAADAVFTLTYVTESGRTGTFESLHVEEAPISLLAEDAMTGATQIAFETMMGEGKYTVYNMTGEAVTELTIVNNDGSEEAENLVAEGLADGASVEVSKEAAVDAVFTLTYVTESGRTGTFETLHVEEAPITLLAEDAMTGATQIAFSAPEK